MPEAFTLGPLLLPTLRTAVIAALFVAIVVAALVARVLEIERRWVRAVVDLSILVGLLGARAGFVLTHWHAYAEQPWSALYLWEPGYSPLGGIAVGGAFALWRIGARPADRWRHALPLLGGFAVSAVLLAGVYASLHLPDDASALRPQSRTPGPTLQALLGRETRSRLAGSRMPAFTLQDLHGRAVSSRGLAGRAVVLNFWATWCAPCRREIPLLDAMHRRYREAGLTVLGVAVGETPAQVAGFLEAFAISYPVWVQAPGTPPGEDLFARFDGVGFPTTYFIDADGVIRDVHVGELARAPLVVGIEALLQHGR